MPDVKPREIRVFLSSTFRDMDAERSHLVKQVFPKVRAACHARQVGFTEIDLRWGVTEEESKNGATVEICLKEIDRCRDFPPFFIGFLGERYGWIPKHEDLATYWQKHKDSAYAQPIQKAVERGISVTELEMELAVLAEGAAERIAGHALFLLRDRALTDSLYRQETGKTPNPADLAFYDPAAGKLDALKERIRQTQFLCTNDGSASYTAIEQFGTAIETYLLAQLDRHFPEDAVPTQLERQKVAHATFRYHRLQNFLPREDVRKKLIDAIEKRFNSPHLGPILLAGPSGQGKSALMADLARQLETTRPEWIVLDHYVGADDTSSLDSWARRILETLHPRIHDLVTGVPETPKDQKEALSSWIAMACRRHEQRHKDGKPSRLVLILDALNQNADGGKTLDLLKPEVLGSDAIVIASAADGTPARGAAKDYETQEVPPFTTKLKARMIRGTLARYRKKLTPELAQKLADAPQSGSPLFLGLALEELRLDASHESLEELVNDILEAKDAEELFLKNFLLDPYYSRPAQPDLAVRFMALIGAARAGLSEIELADLLAIPTDPTADDTGKSRLPQKYLSYLLSNFRPFLLNRVGNRAPMHRKFGEVALRHLGEDKVREQIYDYFKKGYGRDNKLFNVRQDAEALYQIVQLAKNNHLGKTSYRNWLVADLGIVCVPVWLRQQPGKAEDVVREALSILTASEGVAIEGLWRRGIETLEEELLLSSGPYFSDFGRWLATIPRFSLALTVLNTLKARQENVPDGDADITLTVSVLAAIYIELGKYDEALPLTVRSLEINQQLADEGLRALGSSYSTYELAVIHHKIGNLEAAESLCQRSITLFEKHYGSDNSHLPIALNQLALILGDKGDFAGQEDAYRRALALSRETLGSDHLETARVMANLGIMLSKDKLDCGSAEELLRRSLEIREIRLGTEHIYTGHSAHSLGCLLSDREMDFEAEPLLRQAHSIYLNAFGSDHELTISCRGVLAVCLCGLGLRCISTGGADQARLYLKEALYLAESISEEDVVFTCKELLARLNSSDNDRSLLTGALDKYEELRKQPIATPRPATKGERTMSMRITDVVVEWLEMMEWEERPEVNEEKLTSSTSFVHNVGDDFAVNCFLDTNEHAGFVKLFMYFQDAKIPAAKIDEVIKFANLANIGITIGHLTVIPDERILRYYTAIDVEEASLEIRHISNMLNAGLRSMKYHLPQFMAICFGGKTAEEALEIEEE